MQEVITHPEGVLEGAAAPAAREQLDTEIGAVVAPSDSLTAESRLAIYSSMYFARLMEVLGEDFPAVRDAVGELEFGALLRDYLIACPSTHYSLNMLGEHFPAFLDEREPGPGTFVVELARLERAVQEVFDAPAVDTVTAADLEQVPQETWATARIQTVPSLRAFAFEHPVNPWYQSFREERQRPRVEAEPSWVVLYRRNHRVWRLDLSREQYAILAALIGGTPLVTALEEAAALPGIDVEALTASLGEWFGDWTGMGFFAAIG